MSEDLMRTELAFKLVCSGCGEILTADYSQSRFEFGSACKGEAVFRIHPCQKCLEDARKPAKMIRDALAMSEKIDKETQA